MERKIVDAGETAGLERGDESPHEACAAALAAARQVEERLEEEIDEVERRIVQLEIERQALLDESDAAAGKRRHSIESELAELGAQSQGMKARWQAEKDVIEEIQALRTRVDDSRVEA